MNFRLCQKQLGALLLLFVAVVALAACGGSSEPATTQMGGAIQGRSLTAPTKVSTLAGLSSLTRTQFQYPGGIATDGTYLYVSDDNVIKKISIATGDITTLPGPAGGHYDPSAAPERYGFDHITCYGKDLYTVNLSTIRKVDIETGAITFVAGSGGGYAEATPVDGTGSQATFAMIGAIATDGTNLYIGDNGLRGSAVRKVVIATGEVTTIAGRYDDRNSLDGTGSAASFASITGIAINGGYLYVSDVTTVRKVEIATGTVTTVAGKQFTYGSTDGVGTAARFQNCTDITTDGTNLFINDGKTIRKMVIQTGEVTTLAGNPLAPGGSTDGTGTAARFVLPCGVTTDGKNVYVVDRGNRTVRAVAIATGAVTTLARGTSSIGSTDGVGEAARFQWPYGITTDGANLYVTDCSNATIRKIVIATGETTTIAGSAADIARVSDGVGLSARFLAPSAITCDGRNLYIADDFTIRKMVLATGEVTTLAGTAGVSGFTDGTGSAARFSYIYGLTTDGHNLYLCDPYNHTIRKVVIASGAVSTLAAGANFTAPYGITTDGSFVYVTDQFDQKIRRISTTTGTVTTVSGFSGLLSPRDLTTDGKSLFVIDSGGLRTIDIATGAMKIFPDASITLQGITTDGKRLYVTNSVSNTVDVLQ